MNPETRDQSQADLEVFRQEISRLLKDIQPEELTVEDMLLWNKIKNESVIKADMEIYISNLTDAGPNASRKAFMRLAIDKATALLGAIEIQHRADLEGPRR